jgi:DNA-binding CsgD family transcriptional regulator
MELLERAEPLELLRGLVDQAVEGRGRIVALVGEAGVGKTTLAQALVETYANLRVLRGACEDLAIPDPLGPLRDLAREAGWDLDLGRHERPLALFSQALERFDRPESATLVVIEDLHWGDDATLDLVRFLGRRLRSTRILLLVTARDDAAPGRERLRRALATVPPDDVVRVAVAPLSLAAVARLAGAAGVNTAELYRLTGGNPFFVGELLRAGQRGGPPPSVRDAVLTRADRLPAASRRVLDAASILPGAAETATLRAICGPVADEGIEACIAAGMLEPRGDGCAFRHELARRAVEGALSPATRRALNSFALAHLQASDSVPIARLLHHAKGAGAADLVRSLAPRAAREAAAVGAHREAAAHYLAALAVPDAYPEAERLQLLEGCSYECFIVGRLAEAVRAQEAVLAAHRARGDCCAEGDALRWLSRLRYIAGDRISAEPLAHRAVELLAATPGPELAMAYANLSTLAMLANETDAAIRHGRAAVALAEQHDRPDILCHALTSMGAAEAWVHPERGLRHLARSREIALARSDSEEVGRAWANEACIEICRTSFNTAAELLRAGIAYCLEHQADGIATYMLAELADLLVRLGRWDEAAALARQALEAGNDNLARFVATVALARLHTRRGDGQVASLLADLERFLETGSESCRVNAYACLLAERAWLGAGDRAEALRLLDAAAALVPDAAMAADVIAWQRLLAPERPLPDSRTWPEPYRRLFAGDWQGAAEAWAAAGATFDEALALLEGGPQAQRRALARLESLGARAVAGHVRELLRRRGVAIVAEGPRASTRANPAGLTRRQMDVLRLIDQGQSNALIAARLYVSPKTVDHHVSAILDKLGVRSRSEAAAAARRSGLL